MNKRTLRKLFYTSVFAVAGSTAAMAQGTITTIAGTGTAGFSGDGGPAIAAQFSGPYGVATDGSGNIFVADKNNNKIRKIDAMGNITSIAGPGVPGWMASATLHLPVSVFVDASDELLFTGWYSDAGFYTDPVSGETFGRFGCGSQGSSGDGGPACLAKTKTPTGSCEDNFGNTYVADFGSNRIRKVDAATGIITTIVNGTGTFGYAGDGEAALDARMANPSAVFFDPTSPGAGHLYISDAGNHVVRKVDLNTNTITTVAGTGVAGYSGNWGMGTSAQLRSPGGLFIDAHKNLFICDRGNNVIRKMNLERNVISTVAGNGTAGFSGDAGLSTYAQLNNPQGVWADNAGNLYIADAGNQRIRRVNTGVFPATPRAASGGVSGAAANTVMVYPNPADGIFNISAGEEFANASVTILNVLGATVYSGTLAGQLGQANLSDMAAGTYTLIVKSNSSRHIEMLTVN